MANEKNLKPIRSESEAREKGKKGGQKSGEARREKRELRELLKTMLTLEIEDAQLIADMEAWGIKDKDLKTFTLLGLIKAAARGNHKAFEILLELTGEKQTTHTKQEQAQEKMLEAIKRSLK